MGLLHLWCLLWWWGHSSSHRSGQIQGSADCSCSIHTGDLLRSRSGSRSRLLLHCRDWTESNTSPLHYTLGLWQLWSLVVMSLSHHFPWLLWEFLGLDRSSNRLFRQSQGSSGHNCSNHRGGDSHNPSLNHSPPLPLCKARTQNNRSRLQYTWLR